jgi:hypothetical protein
MYGFIAYVVEMKTHRVHDNINILYLVARELTWRPVTQRTNQWHKGSEIYWICSGQPVSCRLIARKLSVPQTSTAYRSPETACRIYCISPFWLPCNSDFIINTKHTKYTHTRTPTHTHTHTHTQFFPVNREI